MEIPEIKYRIKRSLVYDDTYLKKLKEKDTEENEKNQSKYFNILYLNIPIIII